MKANSGYSGIILSGPVLSENKLIRDYSGLPQNITKYVNEFHTNSRKEYKL